jgi:RNA polymerase sigma-70 factor (ECF subfamily)
MPPPLIHAHAVLSAPLVPAASFDTAGGEASHCGSPAAEEASLVARAARGDVAAFGLLVDRYQRPMAAVVARMTSNPDDVDDVVQELFIRAWKGLPRFRGDAQFSTWLYRIAVNTAIKHRSRRRADSALSVSIADLVGGEESLRSPRSDSGGGGAGCDPYEVAVCRDRDSRVRRAVHALPDKQRVVVALYYFEGRSCEEIGQILGCSVGTVWSRLHYACKRLKGLLEPIG